MCVCVLSFVSLCEGLRYYYYFKYSLPWGGGNAQGKSQQAAYLSEEKSKPRSTGTSFTQVCSLEVKKPTTVTTTTTKTQDPIPNTTISEDAEEKGPQTG